MSANITRGGKQIRPSFSFSELSGYPLDAIAAQMLESIRNVLEDIQNSQMLQCDVRSAIYEIKRNTDRTRIALERIDRRLAKVEKLK